MRHYTKIFVVLLAVALFACGEEKKSDEQDAEEESSGGAQPNSSTTDSPSDTDPAFEFGPDAAMVGTWTQTCVWDSESDIFQTSTFEFAENTYSHEVIVYNSTAQDYPKSCDDDNDRVLIYRSTGSYETAAINPTTDPGYAAEVRFVNWIDGTMLYTILDQSLLDQWNGDAEGAIPFCSDLVFELGVETSVLDKGCLNSDLGIELRSGTMYDIYKANDEVFVDSLPSPEFNGKSADKRVKEIGFQGVSIYKKAHEVD